jgi:hypothetical protein
MNINKNDEKITTIIIPYRNRKKHLDYFIKKSVPLLKKYIPNLNILIIEQENGKPFNRGYLLNIGVNESDKNCKYIFTHDIDINPYKKFILDLYCKELKKNDILGIFTSCSSLGGICKYNKSDFIDINGYSNKFWGWGAEDRDIYNRSIFYKKNVIFKYNSKKTNTKILKKIFLRFDDIIDRKPILHREKGIFINNFSKLSRKKQQEYILSSGMNNLNYNIIDVKNIENNVKIIKVKLNDSVVKHITNIKIKNIKIRQIQMRIKMQKIKQLRRFKLRHQRKKNIQIRQMRRRQMRRRQMRRRQMRRRQMRRRQMLRRKNKNKNRNKNRK